MTNGFALIHDKNLQIYFCVKRQAKNDFLKDVESTVVHGHNGQVTPPEESQSIRNYLTSNITHV